MKSMITEVFCGNRGNQQSVQPTENYRRLMKLAVEKEGMLTAMLTADQLKLYREASETMGQAHAECVERFFSEGFKIGLLIGLEAAEG